MAHVLFPPQAEDKIKVGETIKVWGNDSKELLNLSDNQGTIPYELLCQITSRVPRIYELK
jgi:alanine racemase